MSQKEFDPTCGGERTYSGVSKVIDDTEVGDLYGNDFPGAWVESPNASNAPAVDSAMYDAVIGAKYGVAAAARAQAVRGTPVELPLYEDIQSKAPEAMVDELEAVDTVPAAERSRLKLLRMRERHKEIPKVKDDTGSVNLENHVLKLDDATLIRDPGSGEIISAAEAKRKLQENEELKRQMQVLKEGARIRAEEAAALAEPPEDVQPFRTRQTLASIADASDSAKQQLRDELNVISREEFEGVAAQIAEIHQMLASLTKRDKSYLGNSKVTTTDEVKNEPATEEDKTDADS